MEFSDQDEHLISLLRENARLSVSEIARRLSVSRTAAQMRLQKLERTGVIEGYSVRLSESFSKDQIRALVMIKSPPGKRSKIENALTAIPQLTTLYSISGAFDLSAVISAASVADLDAAIDEIGRLDGVEDTLSSVILSTKIDR
ncbi:MAG: AsnC family transcriptional regulator [Gammaproteobacteria bacterium]|nr:MAG: AsnC family transcriptional regulator [Gammaproteobacteria bacterium]